MLRTLVALLLATAAAPAAVGLGGLSVHNEGRIEYVQIAAPADSSLVLTGGLLASGVGGQKFVFPSLQLAPGSAVRIASGATPLRPGDVLWTKQNVWNNDGDVARVFDSTGTLLAEFAYGSPVRVASALKQTSLKGTRASR